MIIYHGSNVVVEAPNTLHSERLLDFGRGFYTTSNKEQAISWAKQVASRREPKEQILSIYEFDSIAAQRDLAIIRFTEPTAEWLDFVCANRSGRKPAKPYDIVFGPVANDKVYTVVQFYENGVYDKKEAIKRLKVEALFDQILFHTEKSLAYCRFIKFEKLEEYLDEEHLDIETIKFDMVLFVISAGLVGKITTETGLEENIAMEKLYTSALYSMLEDEQTKVWHYSVHLLYELWQREVKTGRLVLPEY